MTDSGAGSLPHNPSWIRADDLFIRITPRSVLVATRDSASPTVLGGGAVAIWNELATPCDDDTLVARVAARCRRPPAALREEVLAARRELCTIGALIEVR